MRINTKNFGEIILNEKVDADGIFCYEMTDLNGGFYGDMYLDANLRPEDVTQDIRDGITPEMVEEQIEENLYY